jgi:uncharacterized Zn-binding protein involved in type VI secretion
MNLNADIVGYNAGLETAQRELAESICSVIADGLPSAAGKVWHGHPVWFVDSNPVVGYSLKKSGLEVLFWSGQSFVNSDLRPIGKFKAAGLGVAATGDVAKCKLFLAQALAIQWNYRDLPKLRKLEKLTDF